MQKSAILALVRVFVVVGGIELLRNRADQGFIRYTLRAHWFSWKLLTNRSGVS